MGRWRVLVVDDEPDILELLEHSLTRHGFDVSGCATGEECLAQARTLQPNLIILDLSLPGRDGLSVCVELRRRPETAEVPILILSARGEEADIVSGLELGADDYVTKPFRPRVLAARARALLRRARPGPGDEARLVVGPLEVDPRRREARAEGAKLELTYSEFELLNLLARSPGRVFTRGQVIDALRGPHHAVTERSVDVLVAGLRRKLGATAQWLETVRGVGYRLRG